MRIDIPERITIGWCAKILKIRAGKFTYDVQKGTYPFVRASKGEGNRWRYSWDKVALFNYIEEYYEFKRKGLDVYE